MTKNPERLAALLRSPAQLRIALDFLDDLLREGSQGRPVSKDSVSSSLNEGLLAAEALANWCVENLAAEQLRALHKALRLAANHQRVYKRTVMLSPRAHLLVKTLAEQEGLKMSDVIELYLDGILRNHAGLAVRTSVSIQNGLVEHEIVPIAGASGAD